jgi:hypothetical protein
MVTAEISVKLGSQSVVNMLVHYGGDDSEVYERRLAAAVQRSMMRALGDVQIPPPAVQERGRAEEARR